MSWFDLVKASDDWRKNLKYGGKPKPKAREVIIKYLKINPKSTMVQIQRHLENTHPRGMTTKTLRKFLEEHKNIEVSGRYPTKYSYRGE